MLDPETLSVLSFWADAGVDYALEDLPQDRLRPASLAPAPLQGPPPAEAPSAAAEVPGPILAERAAASAANVGALAAAIAAFEGCPLKFQGAARAAAFRGALSPALLVIGEAPGAEEDREGRAFAGPSGQLLDKMLKAAELLDEALVSHAVFWRPPGDRSPNAEELAVCAPFLRRLAELARPKAVLLLGGLAAQALLGDADGIVKIRGRWREIAPGDGGTPLPALPTFAPAFLLRQPMQKKAAWADLLAVRARLSVAHPAASADGAMGRVGAALSEREDRPTPDA